MLNLIETLGDVVLVSYVVLVSLAVVLLGGILVQLVVGALRSTWTLSLPVATATERTLCGWDFV